VYASAAVVKPGYQSSLVRYCNAATLTTRITNLRECNQLNVRYSRNQIRIFYKTTYCKLILFHNFVCHKPLTLHTPPSWYSASWCLPIENAVVKLVIGFLINVYVTPTSKKRNTLIPSDANNDWYQNCNISSEHHYVAYVTLTGSVSNWNRK